MHNIGAHLADYVQLFGPLWAWSCFAFEDSNSMILHAVLGTGNVVKQVLRYRAALSLLRASSMYTAAGKQWRKRQDADGCTIPGASKCLPSDTATPLIVQKVGATDVRQLQVLRVQVAEQKLYSEMYRRMKKIICYVLLTTKGKTVLIRFFVLNIDTKKVYAVVRILYHSVFSPLSSMEAGKHLVVEK